MNKPRSPTQIALEDQKTCLQMVYRCQAEVDKLSTGPGVDLKKTKALISVMKGFQQEFRQGQVALGLSRPRITTRKPQDLVGVAGDTIAEITAEYAEDKKAQKKLKVV